MDGIFYLYTKSYQIQTYRFKFGFHKIRELTNQYNTLKYVLKLNNLQGDLQLITLQVPVVGLF